MSVFSHILFGDLSAIQNQVAAITPLTFTGTLANNTPAMTATGLSWDASLYQGAHGSFTVTRGDEVWGSLFVAWNSIATGEAEFCVFGSETGVGTGVELESAMSGGANVVRYTASDLGLGGADATFKVSYTLVPI